MIPPQTTTLLLSRYFFQLCEIWCCNRSLFALRIIYLYVSVARSSNNARLEPSRDRIGTVPCVDRRTPSSKVASTTAGYYCLQSIHFDRPVSCF